jgi:predicted ATPase
MISEIILKNFKSIKSANLKLGPFNLFIGTNASGKSNFLDGLRFIQGLAYGFTVDEVLNGKAKSDTSEVWERIRGGSERVTYLKPNERAKYVKRIVAQIKLAKEAGWPESTYQIEINAKNLAVRKESLVCDRRLYDSDPDGGLMPRNDTTSPVLKVWYNSTKRGPKPSALPFEKSRPVLGQIVRTHDCDPTDAKRIRDFASRLSSMQRVDPQTTVLRSYSTSRSAKRMGEKGENFASVVRAICEGDTKDAYLSWLRELRPEEIDDVGWMEGADGEVMFSITEGGTEFPASVLSDGTLRFAAIAAAFFQPDMPRLMSIEEIENGVNPARMRVLMNLLRQRAGQSATQVLATTHSPLLLDWLEEDEWQYTFICHRDSVTGATRIVPLTEVPGFIEVAREGEIGKLLSEGWLDFAL